jgi:hypothetical protein
MLTQLIKNAMKKLNGIEKVSAKGDKLTANLSNEIMSKLDKISVDSLNEKTILNRSVWKSEILKGFRTEKTARRILRAKQFELSSKVIKFAKLNLQSELKNASLELEKFYFDNLVVRSKFSNIDKEKVKGAIIQTASEISINCTK